MPGVCQPLPYLPVFCICPRWHLYFAGPSALLKCLQCNSRPLGKNLPVGSCGTVTGSGSLLSSPQLCKLLLAAHIVQNVAQLFWGSMLRACPFQAAPVRVSRTELWSEQSRAENRQA